MKSIRKILSGPGTYILKHLDLLSLYSLKVSGILKEDGWFRSFSEESSIDADENPLPWYTYPAIHFIKNRLMKDMTVFEYGCGFSTLWWADRVQRVVSVEHDEKWYNQIKKLIPENVELNLIKLDPIGSYQNKISDYHNMFDIIILDGRERVKCSYNSIDALKENGIIIWDNSDREEYIDGYQFLHNKRFKKIEFVGISPMFTIKSETGIFYRENNVFGL